ADRPPPLAAPTAALRAGRPPPPAARPAHAPLAGTLRPGAAAPAGSTPRSSPAAARPDTGWLRWRVAGPGHERSGGGSAPARPLAAPPRTATRRCGMHRG